MKYRVWHNCQIGRVGRFFVEVKNIKEAWFILNVLWKYDMFQYSNCIKGDYSSVSGLEYFDEYENDWCEWYDDNGLDIKDHFKIMK